MCPVFFSPCVVYSGLTQDPQGHTHTSQKLIPKLQIAGVPQVHPEHKEHGTDQTPERLDAMPSSALIPAQTRQQTDSPQRQFVNILLFNVKLPLCVAQWPRYLEMEKVSICLHPIKKKRF